MTTARPDWEALRRGISGTVLLPGIDGYEQARTPFVAGFDDVAPRAVVRCAAAEDVAEVIAFARRYGIETATRSGGHSFAGYSSTRGIVVDVTPMRSVTTAGGVVEVGAGARIGELCSALLADGVAVPTGTCPSVGIGGITLGGGHGVLGRAYGLTLDHLLVARVVLADGRVVECDEHRDAELFWALRGAGSRTFGVVTSFTFQPRPAASMTSFRLVWPYAHAAAVVAAWQGWAPYAPDELAAELTLSVADEPVVAVYGALLGNRRHASDLLEDLVTAVGCDPVSVFCSELSYLDTTRYQAGIDGSAEHAGQTEAGRGYRFTRSEFFDRPLPGEAITALVNRLTVRHTSWQNRSLVFAPWGGAYNRRPPQATAFAHRDQLFLLEHLVLLAADAPGRQRRAADEWAEGSWAAVHPWGSGRVYPNFPDRRLRDWGHAYYGRNYARLLNVKAKYDPDDIFRIPQAPPDR
jgi:FAD/FMN-containing dehydrogenase